MAEGRAEAISTKLFVQMRTAVVERKLYSGGGGGCSGLYNLSAAFPFIILLAELSKHLPKQCLIHGHVHMFH